MLQSDELFAEFRTHVKTMNGQGWCAGEEGCPWALGIHPWKFRPCKMATQYHIILFWVLFVQFKCNTVV